MLNLFLAGIGGFIGSTLRYLLNISIYHLLDFPLFPIGTLIVNIIGCLVIGFLGGLAETRDVFSPELRIFIFIGILGGFTTFSSFGFETYQLLRDGELLFASLNVIGQVVLGLFAVWIGFVLARLY